MEADQSGSVIGTQTYSPYGSLASSTGTDPPPFGFAGGYTDPTGLVYDQACYYDPATGSFLSVDPLVQYTHVPYEYAGDDPVNAIDPNGLLVLSGKTQNQGYRGMLSAMVAQESSKLTSSWER